MKGKLEGIEGSVKSSLEGAKCVMTSSGSAALKVGGLLRGIVEGSG